MFARRIWLACWLLAGCVEADADTASAPSAVPTAKPTATTSAPPPKPTRPSVEAVLAAIPEDPPHPKIIRQTHYFVSNEHRPEAFRQHVTGLGGIFVGVGAEQNYLFAGWARPDVLLLVDFDQWVVDVHFIHGVLMRHASSPEAFVELWSGDQKEEAVALLTNAAPEASARERILDMHRITHQGVYAQLSHLRVRLRGAGIPTWLTDRAQYDHVAGLFRQGRARALRGDFTGRRTMAGIARAARKLGLPMRGIYVSNIEDYFDYDSGLGRNLLAQPTDARSLLLRSVPVDSESYVYVSQRMTDFRAWIDAGAESRTEILAGARLTKGSKGMFLPGPSARPAEGQPRYPGARR